MSPILSKIVLLASTSVVRRRQVLGRAVSETVGDDATYAQGFTNPIWVEVDGQPVRSRAAAEYSIRWIDKLRQMAEEWPGWRSQKERQHVFSQFDEARAIYQGFLSSASSN